MIPLRKSTASQEVLLGPFLDDTDGKTAETGLTIANTDIKLWKRGGTTESSKNSGGATHIASGRYYAVLDATDTDTTGELILNVAVAGALPVRLVCHVYEAAIFDAFFASGAAGYSTLTAQQVWEYSTRTLSAFSFTVSANVTQWNGGALPTIGTSTLTAQQVWEYGTRTLSAFGFTVSANVVQWNGASLPTIGTSTLTAQQVWEYATRTLSAFGFTVAANVTQWNGGSLPTIGTSTLTAQQVWEYATRTVSAFSFTVAANVTQWNGGALPTIPTAGENADAVWDEAMAGHTTAGTYGGRIPRSDSSNVNVKLTGSAHIAADVHELQPAVIEAQHFALGAIDANAVAADASSEIATAVRTELATELARIDVMVGSRLATASYTAPLTAAGTRLAIGLAAANLDSQLDAIPTAAEIDTQLSGTHGGGAWGSIGSGSGAYTFTVTVNDGTTALQNATVRLVEGVNNYVAVTNASGVAVFALDAATYSVAISKAGYSFTPTTKVIANTTSQTYSMSAVTPTLPAAANLSTGTAICYGTTGLPIAGVVVTIQQVQGTGTDGSAYDGDTFTLTSNASGVISHNGFVRGATYSIRRGIRGEAKSFTVPNAVSFDLSEIVGRD